MKFFLDTADLKELREAKEMGFLDGVTTNPTLIARSGRPFDETIREICALTEGPVSAECVGTAFNEMFEEGKTLAALANNVVVKVPLTREGLKTCRALTREGIRVNVTLCFTPLQALMAAKAGAAFISPFVGRLDDRGERGMEVVEQIRTIYDNYGLSTEVLVASIRHPIHVLDAALAGADVSTMPFDTLAKMIQHPLTDLGVEAFLRDYQKIPKK
jgi:transaldolase